MTATDSSLRAALRASAPVCRKLPGFFTPMLGLYANLVVVISLFAVVFAIAALISDGAFGTLLAVGISLGAFGTAVLMGKVYEISVSLKVLARAAQA
ncbi:hypothetical protein [Marinovum sp.]|uniref:hypothetical protein n=1 Tax=Marinovum sp. TaxID=2024839 RepID=UPI002B26BD95|nr:hypothetical protein [Marinovum sp.]